VEQTVAWVLEREGGGRSFGSTLGHFHDNYAIPEFRRAIVNGILWTAGVEVDERGAAVELSPEQLELPPPEAAGPK
jgi:type 1 glutamine amidotransferase